MRIAVSATGNDLDSPFSPVFGRCPVYVLVDTETMASQPLPNHAMNAAGGAGIQAAQEVARQGVGAVVTGNVGPNAYRVLASAGVRVYIFGAGTVRQAVEAFKAGQLATVGGPTGPAHAGMGMMRGGGMGRGQGGPGTGGSMGRGQGGLGTGGARGLGYGSPGSPVSTPPQPPAGSTGQDDEILDLRAEIRALHERLGQIVDKIDGLKSR